MSSQQNNFSESILNFLSSKVSVKKTRVFLKGNYLQIDYIPEENQDLDSIIPNNIDELQALVSKHVTFSQILWSENLLIVS